MFPKETEAQTTSPSTTTKSGDLFPPGSAGYRVVIGGSPYSASYSSRMTAGAIPGFPSSPHPPVSTASTANASPAPSGTALLMMAAQLEAEVEAGSSSSSSLPSQITAEGSPSSASSSLPPKKRSMFTASGTTGRTASNSNKKRKAASKKKAAAKVHAVDYGDDLRGITMRASGKWQAQLYYAGQSRYIGVFETRAKAAIAYEIVRDTLKTERVKHEPQTTEKWEQAVKEARKAAGVDEEKDEKKAESAAGRKSKAKSAAVEKET